jgi:hypothetical protein
MERPDERKFDFDCQQEAMRDRHILVVAGLTVLKAYHDAGRPEGVRPMGSFEDWDWVRGALVWLGRADPALTRAGIFSGDPMREELSTVMDLWAALFKSQKVRVNEIEEMQQGEAYQLRARLVETCCRGAWSSRAVGRWLTRNKDKVIGGRYFSCMEGAAGHGHQWVLRVAQGTMTIGNPE